MLMERASHRMEKVPQHRVTGYESTSRRTFFLKISSTPSIPISPYISLMGAQSLILQWVIVL